jgi:putative lipoprotein
MIKILKDICKIVICLIFILFISACSSQEKNEKSSNKKESYQYTIYNANADIQNFEFIHDKNGIIVEWDFENNKVAKAINSSDWIRVNPNFLVRERQKLRRATASKEMKSDEFAYLDIFDLTNKKATKKEVDVWKLMVTYLKNDNIELHGSLPTLRRIGANDYVVLSITEQKKYRYFLLNLKTLKIDAEKTEQELNQRNKIDVMLYTKEALRAGVEPFDNGFWKSEDYKGGINLKRSNSSAFTLFSKKNSFAYKVINSENGIIINSKDLINLETEFLKTGASVYDGLYLPGKWSTEGQDTKITSYEDIQKYYNGKLVSE